MTLLYRRHIPHFQTGIIGMTAPIMLIVTKQLATDKANDTLFGKLTTSLARSFETRVQ